MDQRATPAAMVTWETIQLLTDLVALNRKVPQVVTRIGNGSLSADDQEEFGSLLIAMGEAIQEHAREHRTAVVIDSAGTTSDNVDDQGARGGQHRPGLGVTSTPIVQARTAAWLSGGGVGDSGETNDGD